MNSTEKRMLAWAIRIASILSLIALLALPSLYALGRASQGLAHFGIMIGTIGWFVTAPFWIKSGRESI